MAKSTKKPRRSTSQKIFAVLSVILIAVMVLTSIASLFAQ
jgi:hypothetical protein